MTWRAQDLVQDESDSEKKIVPLYMVDAQSTTNTMKIRIDQLFVKRKQSI